MKAAKVELSRRLDDVEQEFVGLWRNMSALWGISPTMAEIHGLLFITGAATVAITTNRSATSGRCSPWSRRSASGARSTQS
jgi:hypothetical protein